MKLAFPSPDFDEAVAAVCHGLFSEDQARALNELLRSNPAARDEYLLRIELHARLGSDPELFAFAATTPQISGAAEESAQEPLLLPPNPRRRFQNWGWGLAASAAFLALLYFFRPSSPRNDPPAATSRAIAMLNRAVDARWSPQAQNARVSGPLEPGWLRLESGMAQVVFYSGARVVLQGPAELQLVSQNEAYCKKGKLVADVPPQARGFKMETPDGMLTDLGTSFGLQVRENHSDLHVFSGLVKLKCGARDEQVAEGGAAAFDTTGILSKSAADSTTFASLFDLREKSIAAETIRHDQWRIHNQEINANPSLLARFDFENFSSSGWLVQNVALHKAGAPDGAVVGCQRGEGRWPEKKSLEFQSVSDRVRLNIPGEFEALTFTAWISVKGLDRKINSLFMCDGFEAGTVHWLIRNDGAPGLTVIGSNPLDYQIATGPPVLTLEKFGMWLHLAVALDGRSKKISQYLNGALIQEKRLRIAPPFRIGAAELGNWNAKGFPKDDPFMIRNFSGAMDEFCLFTRALSGGEIRALYAAGRPQGETLPQAPGAFPK